MKLSIQLSKEFASEPEVIIQAQAMTEEVKQIYNVLAHEEKQDLLMGEREGTLYPVNWQEVIRLYVEGRGVSAMMIDGKLLFFKMPLYAIEKLVPASFCRISKSELIHLKYLKSLKQLPNGMIEIHLAHQIKTYCSRHYVRNIKERLK